MATNRVLPAFRLEAFICPRCEAYAQQFWTEDPNLDPRTAPAQWRAAPALREMMTELPNPTNPKAVMFSVCSHCHQFAIWVGQAMVYPAASTAPLPTADMPDEVKDDYLEARNILNASPRGSAALLRLALQKLMVLLGEKGKHIDEDIASLVKKGLPEAVQQALDAVRLIGNSAVHPGQIDLKDDVGTASALFDLLNFIVERMITQPKQINTIYSNLPASAQAQIKKRDGKP